MTFEVAPDKWNGFFAELSQRHSQWNTRLELFNEFTGKQLLSEGLPFNEITTAQKGNENVIEISVGGKIARQMHVIESPSAVIFFDFQNFLKGVLEIQEKNGTVTLLHFNQPLSGLDNNQLFPV